MRLDGTKVLLTGSFKDYSRSEAVAALQSRGAIVTDQMAMDVEIVFAGEEPGAEVDAAMELGARVADEAALSAALAGKDAPAKPEAPVAMTIEAEPPPASAIPPSARPEAASGDRAFEKGARVRIIGGKEGVGEVGDIFWWGDSKFGDGMRAGVTGADGTKYWVDEQYLAWPDAEVDEEAMKEAKVASAFARGDSVRVKSGKHAGATGTIFWWGDSKWGDGMRAGVDSTDGEKLWIDAEHLEAMPDEDSDIPF